MEIPNYTAAFSEDNRVQVSPASLADLKHRINEASNKQPIDIILLTYNRYAYFQKTVAALIQRTRYPYRLIVVDNNSSPEMRSYLQSTAGLYDHLILNDENYHTVAFQRGIACAVSDPYVVSDPDILVPDLEGPCWLERLVNLHQKYPEMGLIALNLDPANKPAKLPDVYIGEKIIYSDEITLGNVGTVMQSIKRRYFDGCYLTDWETCQQIRDNGGKVGFASRIIAWHLGWDEDRDYPEYLVEKFDYFREKYGAETYRMYTEKEELLSLMNSTTTPGYYGYSRPDVQQLVNPASRRILDIGCAAGMLGHELKQRLGAEVWGVELSPQVAEQAEKHLDRVLTGTIEGMLPQLPNDYFDTIIMADVLEHLVEPGDVLNALHAKLTASGEIVVSLPNVRHWSVVKQLLEGHWEYTDAGILDRTHLRFFTCSECQRLLTGAGYVIKRREAIQLKGEETIPPGVVAALQSSGLAVESLAEESTHYQYLFVASSAKVQPGGQKSTAVVTVAHTAELTSIIILTWNQLSLTQACLESIRSNTSETYELIVVDNGSNDGTVTWLRQQAETDRRITVIENADNLGFAAGCNQGIRAAKGSRLVLLNNDTVVTPDWLTGMNELLERYPDAGIIGPMTNSASGIQVVPDVEYTPDSLPAWAETFRQQHRYRVIPQRRIVGFCMLFRRELVEKVGLLDESFGAGNYEDDDFCLRAELAGYRNLIAGDVFIHHEGGASFSGNNLIRGVENRNNRVKFRQKWDSAGLEESLLRRWLVLHAIEEATVQAQRGDIKAAIDTLLNKAIRVDSGAAAPYITLVEILIAAGRYDDALEVLPEMPSDADQLLNCELEAICRCARGEDVEARQAASSVLGAGRKSPRATVVMGTLAARRGDLAEAESLFRKAIQDDPSSAGAWMSLGMLYWGNNDHAGAWQAFERTVVINPLHQNALGIYRDLAARVDRTAEAAKLIGEAVQVWPDSRALALAHAEMLAECGLKAEALMAGERFLTLFEADDELLRQMAELRRQQPEMDSVTMLSLCMIVRNEEKTLPRCLASLKPVVDEMIIVDTGSDDRTAAIAEAFGARLGKFPWNGNFSDARNASLDQARGRWVLVMDADEVLAEQDYTILKQSLQSKATLQAAWSVITRNYTNRAESEGWRANGGSYPLQEQGDGWYPSRKVRLFPAAKNIRFKGDIHEMVEADLRTAAIPIEQAGFVVHHYGELTESDRRVKQLRYYELGRQKLAERPDDTTALLELALQAGELGLFDEALELWDRLLDSGVHTRDVYFNRCYVLMGLKRFNEAADMARKALDLDPDHKESALNLAACELQNGAWEKAWQRASALSVQHRSWPLLNALRMALAVIAGDKQTAADCLEQLRLDNYAILPYLEELQNSLIESGQPVLAGQLAIWTKEELYAKRT